MQSLCSLVLYLIGSSNLISPKWLFWGSNDSNSIANLGYVWNQILIVHFAHLAMIKTVGISTWWRGFPAMSFPRSAEVHISHWHEQYSGHNGFENVYKGRITWVEYESAIWKPNIITKRYPSWYIVQDGIGCYVWGPWGKASPGNPITCFSTTAAIVCLAWTGHLSVVGIFTALSATTIPTKEIQLLCNQGIYGKDDRSRCLGHPKDHHANRISFHSSEVATVCPLSRMTIPSKG